MLYQKQTIFGDKTGNCFSTCVASIFDLNTEEVPNFCAYEPLDDWWKVFDSWLQMRGYRAIDIKSLGQLVAMPGVIFIASGPSPRFKCDHSVICMINENMEFQVIMDPHPDNTGLAGPFTSACFIIKAVDS